MKMEACLRKAKRAIALDLTLIIVLVSALAGQAAAKPPFPVGDIFTVAEPGGASDVAIYPDGSFVVTWVGSQEPGLYARRFDAAGIPLTGEVRLDDGSRTVVFYPSVLALAGGDFAVVWTSNLPGDPAESGLFIQSFDANAAPVSEMKRITPIRAPELDAFAVGGYVGLLAATPDDGLVVVWQEWTAIAGESARSAVLARIYDRQIEPWQGIVVAEQEGIPGVPFPAHYFHPSVASGPEGFLVTWWANVHGDPRYMAIQARLFDSTGAAVTDIFEVSEQETEGLLQLPAAAALPEGWVVAWHDDIAQSIYARRLDAAGTPLGNVLEVGGARNLTFTSLTADDVGTTVMFWMDYAFSGEPGDPGSDYSVIGQTLGRNGEIGTSFQVNVRASGPSRRGRPAWRRDRGDLFAFPG